MKSIKLMMLVLLFLPVAILYAQWEAMGPPGGSFRALAIAPSNDAIQYLASSGSTCNIWKTTDAGNNWSRVGSISYYVYSLSVDPTNPNIVYAGGIYMYKSTNGGASWSQLTLPTNHWYIYGLEVHPLTPTTIMASCYIYAGSYYHIGFLKSTNSGANWVSETLSADTSYGYALAVDPANPNNIYVGGYSYMAGVINPRVFRSTDGGSNFNNISTIPATAYYCYSLLVHPTNSNYIYAGTMYGVYRSTNSGTDWTLVSPSSNYYNYSLTTTPTNDSLLYSGGSGYIYRSTNAGLTWTTLYTGLAGSTFYSVAASRTQANSVYAANNTDFYRSTDMGSNWAAAHNGLLAAPISALANAPSAQATVYVDNEGVSMYKTTNIGATWTNLTKPLACGSLCDIAVYNNSPDTILAFEGSG